MLNFHVKCVDNRHGAFCRKAGYISTDCEGRGYMNLLDVGETRSSSEVVFLRYVWIFMCLN